MRKVMVLNGPNLDQLGTRETEIYGTLTLGEIENLCIEAGEKFGMEIDFRQSNDEAVLIGWLHEAAAAKTFVVFNPAAYTHYSIAIRDAAALLTAGLIEVHLSNVMAREKERHTSLLAKHCLGTISGFGFDSYVLAVEQLLR